LAENSAHQQKPYGKTQERADRNHPAEDFKEICRGSLQDVQPRLQIPARRSQEPPCSFLKEGRRFPKLTSRNQWPKVQRKADYTARFAESYGKDARQISVFAHL
jgi:hypothetical protein